MCTVIAVTTLSSYVLMPDNIKLPDFRLAIRKDLGSKDHVFKVRNKLRYSY